MLPCIDYPPLLPRLLRRSTPTRPNTQPDAADVPAALHQLMDSDEAMDDADAHTYTTTIIMHGEREVKTKDDDHGRLIGGALAS